MVAYLTNRDETESQLVIVRPDGRGRKVLGTAANCYSFGWAEPSPPAWSRGGSALYFVGRRYSSSSTSTVPPATRSPSATCTARTAAS